MLNTIPIPFFLLVDSTDPESTTGWRNDGVTIESDNVLAEGSETVSGSGSSPETLTASFILPDTWNGKIIDWNVFCNVKVRGNR